MKLFGDGDNIITTTKALTSISITAGITAAASGEISVFHNMADVVLDKSRNNHAFCHNSPTCFWHCLLDLSDLPEADAGSTLPSQQGHYLNRCHSRHSTRPVRSLRQTPRYSLVNNMAALHYTRLSVYNDASFI